MHHQHRRTLALHRIVVSDPALHRRAVGGIADLLALHGGEGGSAHAEQREGEKNFFHGRLLE